MPVNAAAAVGKLNLITTLCIQDSLRQQKWGFSSTADFLVQKRVRDDGAEEKENEPRKRVEKTRERKMKDMGNTLF